MSQAALLRSLSLFMFSMTGIVLAGNLVMMFIFWELVGLELLPAHRPLVSEGQRRRSLQKSLPHQPHRRLRLHDRHSAALRPANGGNVNLTTSRRPSAPARCVRTHPVTVPASPPLPLCASSSAPSANPPSSRSTSGFQTPWKAPRRSPRSSTPPRWWPPVCTCSCV
jgi:hypothetical protein